MVPSTTFKSSVRRDTRCRHFRRHVNAPSAIGDHRGCFHVSAALAGHLREPFLWLIRSD